MANPIVFKAKLEINGKPYCEVSIEEEQLGPALAVYDVIVSVDGKPKVRIPLYSIDDIFCVISETVMFCIDGGKLEPLPDLRKRAYFHE